MKYLALCMVQRRSSVTDSYFSEMIVVNTVGWILMMALLWATHHA